MVRLSTMRSSTPVFLHCHLVVLERVDKEATVAAQVLSASHIVVASSQPQDGWRACWPSGECATDKLISPKAFERLTHPHGRYPPFENTGKLKKFKGMSDLKPNFDRNGNVQVSVFKYILTLGGMGASKGLIRWLAVALGSSTFHWPSASGCDVGNSSMLTIPLVAMGYRQFMVRGFRLS